ncbi:uncharacterized protein LOC109794445 [Cajanus cajan]|uniref:uncharacterized protein LOC109794445 n=1 Tax=Cajanus cajan TaxID=3821 RepID=UPI00098D9DB0|nr:uncharacterized protein LOC109794445 [Cajanus cajan]
MAPYEALYGRRCRTPLCWCEPGDNVILRPEIVQQTTDKVRLIMLSRKLTPRFIGHFQILKRVGSIAYQIALPPNLSNLHDVFLISQLQKYIHDPSHVIGSDHLEVKENLIMEATPVRVEDRMVKQLRGKEIPLVKVIWGGATPEKCYLGARGEDESVISIFICFR